MNETNPNEYIPLLVEIAKWASPLCAVLVAYIGLRKDARKIANNQLRYVDASIKTLNGTAEAIIRGDDAPAWLKIAYPKSDGSVEFRMQLVNRAYERAFGILHENYCGKTDLEAGHTKSNADRFLEHDLLVWNSGKSATWVEDVNGEALKFRKTPLISNDGKVKGVYGRQVI